MVTRQHLQSLGSVLSLYLADKVSSSLAGNGDD